VSISQANVEAMQSSHLGLLSVLQNITKVSQDNHEKRKAASLIARQVSHLFSPPYSSPFNIKLAKTLVSDFREWSAIYKKENTTKLKQEFIRQQSMCKELGIQSPELPDINGIVERPPPTLISQLQVRVYVCILYLYFLYTPHT
jgi:hypothetical protein